VGLEVRGHFGYWVLVTLFILLTAGFILELGTGVLYLNSGATAIQARQAQGSDPPPCPQVDMLSRVVNPN
jgi:hypothetical protein